MGVLVLGIAATASWAAVTRGPGLQPAGPGPTPRDSTATASESVATPTPSPAPIATIRRAEVSAGQRAVARGATEAVYAAVSAIVDRATLLVVADDEVLTPARGVAWRLGVPLVPAGQGLEGLLDRLGTEVVVHVRAEEAAPSDVQAGDREVRVVTVDGATVDRSAIEDVVPAAPPPGPAPQLLVGADDRSRPLLDALATATGATIVEVDGPLVRDERAIRSLRTGGERRWVVAGTRRAWQGTDLDVLAWDVEVARSGVELPGGGLRLFPGRRMVALYGSPGAPSLGVLGEQPVGPAIDRARQLAQDYAPLVDEPVVPTFEIITTVASSGPEPTGDYSRRVPLDRIEPWVDAAEEAGVYVILDLQPGRTDFLTQAKEIAPLLRRPHVGLALDPEWRLRPDQVHLRQIGSVDVDEVQRVADWLADLTRRAGLPQKLLLLHQFRLSMLPDRQQLTVPPELAVAIQMDGQGSQGAKLETWRAVTTLDPPASVWFGWKNFYDEDTTLRSPADTFAVEPSPVLVSYQ